MNKPKLCMVCHQPMDKPGIKCSKCAPKGTPKATVSTQPVATPTGRYLKKAELKDQGWIYTPRVTAAQSNLYHPDESVHPHLHMVVDFSSGDAFGVLRFLGLTKGGRSDN